MRVVVVHNPIAGRGRSVAAAQRVTAAVAEAGHEPCSLPSELAPPEAWLDPALAGADALVVVGGDGAMRLAAPSAARCDVAVYHFPLGTENLFAREFSNGDSISGLIATLERREIRYIDVGCANDRWFLLMASIGFDAEVVADLAAHRRGGISHLSYVRPILRQVWSWRPPVLSVEADGEKLVDGERGLVVVGNCRQYGMRLDIAWCADTTDGLLDVVFLPMRGRLALIRWATHARLHRLDRHPLVRHVRAARVVIERPTGTHFQLDGDAPRPRSGETDPTDGSIEIEVRPGTLPVFVR